MHRELEPDVVRVVRQRLRDEDLSWLHDWGNEPGRLLWHAGVFELRDLRFGLRVVTLPGLCRRGLRCGSYGMHRYCDALRLAFDFDRMLR